MENNPYYIILDNLKSNKGEQEISRLIDLGEQESFYIDYKAVSTACNATRLSENDRKNYAKAISGFSNTSGGLLIWGIAENNGIFFKKEINNPDELVRLLNTEVATLTLPMRTDVNSFAIKLSSGKGYVVTEIPKYYFSPVQVISKNLKDVSFKYYIRSGSSFEPANHDLLSGLYNRQQSSRMIYCWGQSSVDAYTENAESINYKIEFLLQNKGLGVLKDVWVNFTSSGLDIKLEKTNQTSIFTGWNIFGSALNLITVDNYKCGPQHFIYPFLISITILKKSISAKVNIYISFGADKVNATEVEVTIDKIKIENFLKQQDHSTKNFLEYFGFKKSI